MTAGSRLPGIRFGLVALAWIALCACAGTRQPATSPAASQSSTDVRTRPRAEAIALSRYFAASAAFDSLVAEYAARGELPLRSEDRVASVLETLSDSRRFLDSVAYTTDSIDILMAICEKANAHVMVYGLFGLDSLALSEKQPQDAFTTMATMMDQNLRTYQYELVLLYPFQMRCMATQVPVLTAFLLSLPPEEVTDARLDGLRKVRTAFVGVLAGGVIVGLDDRYSHAYRDRILNELATSAPVIASTLTVSARSLIATLANEARDRAAGSLRRHFDAIAEALEDTSCTGLCSVLPDG